MTTERAWLVAAGAVALAALLLAALSWRLARRALARAEHLSARLAEREAAAPPPPANAPAPGPDRPSYVITGIDTGTAEPRPAAPVAQRIDGRLFTDIVARETVVRAASWSHGIRRALSPESRNRIGFQVRQQAKQQRRDRRTEVREALREYRARHRADVPSDESSTRRADEGDAA